MQDIETAAGGHGPTGATGSSPGTGRPARSADTPSVAVHPHQPQFGHQGDTAVARAHRGHRLGLLLKIDMMRWLAEAEPQLEVIETWNNADNRFMINVNEALGYRLSRVFATFERRL